MNTLPRSLGGTLLALGLLASLPWLSGCKPNKVSSPTTTARETHEGRLDWSAWQRWVQSPPRVILVSKISAETNEKIARQTLLFRTVIGDTTPTAAALPQIDELKKSFISANASRPANSPVPAPARWDRYSNAINRLQPDNLTATLNTLGAFVARDQQDLKPHLHESGDIGNQARSDLAWIDTHIQPVIASLKNATPRTGMTQEEARSEWKTFESESLPEIADAMKAATIDSTTVAADGTYRLNGQGKLVAVITVAGRDLYFPADSDIGGLRF